MSNARRNHPTKAAARPSRTRLFQAGVFLLLLVLAIGGTGAMVSARTAPDAGERTGARRPPAQPGPSTFMNVAQPPLPPPGVPERDGFAP